MAQAARIRIRLNRLLRFVGFPKDFFLIPLAAMIGTLGGLAACGFDWLVEASNAFFYEHVGRQSFFYSQNLLLILLPATGGLAVGLIQQFVIRREPSHGVPDVMEALARKRGHLSGWAGVYKTITASLTIGSGGSAGVEGPIIHIGSVLGSVVARTLRVGREHMHTLVGCGAAASLAGIFNAPTAGVVLVLEVMLRDFSFKTFIPIVIASVFGTAVAQAVLEQNEAIFAIPAAMRDYQFAMNELWAYALLGLLCGLVGVLFAKTMHWSERQFLRLPGPRFYKPALGGAMVGVLGVVFLLGFSRPVPAYEPPPFYANGYTVIEAMLNPHSYKGFSEADAAAGQADSSSADAAPQPERATPPLHTPQTPGTDPISIGALTLLAMLAFKLVGTCLTLGSGGSGGVFAPSLFMGAALGGGFGMVLHEMGLFPGLTPATYALAGMAGFLAAMAHAPMTAFLLASDVTQDYRVILPAMLVAILATTASQIISRDSIYTASLRRRGIRVGSFSDMTLLRRLEVAHVPLVPAVVVRAEEPAQKLIHLAQTYAATDYVVAGNGNEYVGMVVGEDVRTALVQREAVPLMIVAELMRTDLPTVSPDETLDRVLDKFSQHDVASLAVVDEDLQVRGVITRSRLMRQYQRALEQT